MKNIAFAGICSAVFVLSVQAIPGDARREEAARQADGIIGKMTPEERLGQLMMDSPEIKRLGVSKYHWWNEALHGIARTGLATVFPQSMGAAASFDKCHKVVKDAALASRATMAAGLDLCSEDTYSALKDEVASGALKSGGRRAERRSAPGVTGPQTSRSRRRGCWDRYCFGWNVWKTEIKGYLHECNSAFCRRC